MARRFTVGTLHNGFRIALSVLALIGAVSLGTGATAEGQESVPFTLSSAAFTDGSRIPDRYTCAGENISPPVAWSGVPKSAKSLALIMDDPDAAGKPWVHWVIFNIDPKTAGLPEGVSISGIGALSGTTSFSSLGYGGPCPPVGRGTHHYVFTLYALLAKPRVEEGATKDEILFNIGVVTIVMTELTGLYSR
jgi:Raf kinase inhibitor-like YbhB/YbcL family protein